MQTVLDASRTRAEWLVRLTAGLPGGIGNTGGECGGLTAPLLVMGLRDGRDRTADGVPVAVVRGHDLLHRFTDVRGTTRCRVIRGRSRVPLRCVGVVRQAPAMCASCMAASVCDVRPPAMRAAHRALYAHWQEQGFHCADAVLSKLDVTAAPRSELRDATTAFMGGTLFTGMTCSALTAGVMALGLARGRIEDSRPRVLRMIGTMAAGGDAFADHVNAFNPAMNRGNELAEWFKGEFGTTQCRALTRRDFASPAEVRAYIDGDGTAACRQLAHRVAARVAQMLAPEDPPSS